MRESTMDTFGSPAKEAPQMKKRSEPPSLQAWHSVLYGRHKRQGVPHQAPIKTIAAAALIMTPDEVYDFNASTAKFKHEYPLPKLIVLGILAGAYIGLGYSLCCLVGGMLSYDLRHEEPGLFNFLFSIFGFPMGLTLCVVAGADLFTSNCMYVVIAMSEGRYGALGALRTLFVSYFCNLGGALMLVGLMSSGMVFSNRAEFVIELANKKVSYPWTAAFVKGILCNWLVCLAVWQGNMARDLTGKFIGIFLPNSAFVAMGFEHSVANMFLIPLSMVLGSDISVGTFLTKNLIPVTLGNIVGGGFFVGAMYALALGTPGHAIQDAWDHQVSKLSCFKGEEEGEEGELGGFGAPTAANGTASTRAGKFDLNGLEDGPRSSPAFSGGATFKQHHLAPLSEVSSGNGALAGSGRHF